MKNEAEAGFNSVKMPFFSIFLLNFVKIFDFLDNPFFRYFHQVEDSSLSIMALRSPRPTDHIRLVCNESIE